MKIKSLEIDGFGVWSGLKIEGLSEGLNVFYGPNEAGKTTLLQFVRSMLYGVSSPRRRYLPPVHGGRPGGSMDVAGPNGRFEIGRHEDTTPDGAMTEQITLTAPDGTRQGEHFLRVLLCNVDEAVFNNVFAVGLREMQELGTLSDTESAELLYRLTAGLDRVSLVDVMRALESKRNRILESNGKPCQVVQFLAEREKLRAEIEELGVFSRRYAHLVGERGEVDADVARLEEEVGHAEQQIAMVELAISLRERWIRRAGLDEQLAAIGTCKPMPDNAVERLDAVLAKQQKHQEQIKQWLGRREALKREFAELAVNESLWRQAARIEAFREQTPWITQLQSQIGEIEAEISGVEFQLGEEVERLGLGPKAAGLATLTKKTLTALQSPAKMLRQCHQRRSEAEQSAATAEADVAALAQQIDAALSARGERDLTGAMDRAGNAVLQLRRRVQIDERLDQLGRYQGELEERVRQLGEHQLLPVWLLVSLGGAFVVCVMLILASVLMGSTFSGWLGALGLVGGVAVVAGKVLFERSNAKLLDASQKQLSVLQLQVQQTKEERDHLDTQLPRGGGAMASRLQTAERDLAELEELTPLDTRRNAARQEAEAASRRLAEASEESKAASRRWRQAVAAAGLPDGIAPKQVQRLTERADRLTDMQRRLVQRREELTRRKRELEALTSRIVQLAADCGVQLTGVNPVEHLQQLTAALGRQEVAVARRDAIRREAKKGRAVQAQHEEAVSRAKHRRRQLLLEAGTDDEREFRERAVRCASAEVLRRDRDALHREIQTAIASHGSEELLRKQIEDTATPAETRRDALRQRLTSVQQQLHARLEKRGQLAEQISTLAADRQLANKYLDLAMVEKRIEEAAEQWQVLAVTCRVLELIRTTYEQQRQPETLCEASGYLDRMTQGRYCRVWTPLGESVLCVDDADGNSLPVEVLSRGTREQLFLSLRLALTSSYARRGATLPLVLDDVLVNFDAGRAKAAAAVLRDFAAQGHQLLVFTCHEHILQMFKSLKAPISQLPSNTEGRPQRIRFEHHDAEPESEPREPKETPAPRRKRAEKPKKPPHDDVEAEDAPLESVSEEAEPVSVVVEPPAKKPRRERTRRPAESVFDADFFDPQETEAMDAWEDEEVEGNWEKPEEENADDDVEEVDGDAEEMDEAWDDSEETDDDAA